ncbi:hypothetical protein HWV62_15164, partial [Athelia sp. TMB]
MPAVVEGIPTLLHASVFLFFAGLVDFLFSINRLIAWITLFVVAMCGGLYVLITILPVIDRQCPYRTPLSEVFWVLFRFLGLLRYRSNGRWMRMRGNMWQGRELAAIAAHPSRTQRDRDALAWTLSCLTEDIELLPFVEGIPSFCSSEDDSHVMRQILKKEDIQLLPRIMGLLRAYQASSSLASAARNTRIISCLNSIARLCNLCSADPWGFLRTYESALRVMIMPLTKEPDWQVAEAAKQVVNQVVEHIHICILLRAQRHTHEYYKAEAARLQGAPLETIAEVTEFSKNLGMLHGWDSSASLVTMLPGFIAGKFSVKDAFGLMKGIVSVRPAFKEAVLQFFIELNFGEMLRPCTNIDLSVEKSLHRRATAFLEASFYTAQYRILTKASNPLVVLARLEAASREAQTLATLLGCDSKAVSSYAMCTAIHMATFMQRHLTPGQHRHPVTYLHAS